jgi:hypothetical protein
MELQLTCSPADGAYNFYLFEGKAGLFPFIDSAACSPQKLFVGKTSN